MKPGVLRRPTTRRWCSSSRRRTGTSPGSSRRTTTTRSSSLRAQTGRLGQDLDRHRPLEDAVVHAEGQREPRSQRQLLGHEGASDGVEITFYEDERRTCSRSQAKQVDGYRGVRSAGGQAILSNDTRNYTVIKLHPGPPTASCRCETTWSRSPTSGSRQAIALTLDRPAIIDTLLKGYADLGNDSPFAPFYPSTNTIGPAAGTGPRRRRSSCSPPPATRTASRPR